MLFVVPIGGADMPVIISLLNSFTGLAAAMTGFVLSNDVLIVSGALVGASGTILTLAMSKAMNRSLFNVLFSGFGSKIEAAGSAAALKAGAFTRRRSRTSRRCSPFRNWWSSFPATGWPSLARSTR